MNNGRHFTDDPLSLLACDNFVLADQHCAAALVGDEQSADLSPVDFSKCSYVLKRYAPVPEQEIWVRPATVPPWVSSGSGWQEY